jgi:hypothetical protein
MKLVWLLGAVLCMGMAFIDQQAYCCTNCTTVTEWESCDALAFTCQCSERSQVNHSCWYLCDRPERFGVQEDCVPYTCLHMPWVAGAFALVTIHFRC